MGLPPLTSRTRTAGWWGLLLMVAVACTADPGEAPVISTSATTTTQAPALPPSTDGADVAATPVDAETPAEPSVTTSAPNPSDTAAPSTSTISPGTTTTLPPATTLIDNQTVVEVVVREGRVVSEERVDIPLNNQILMQFDTDTRLLVHIHGYDQEFWVEVGTSTTFEFEGNIPGIFEVEDHVTHRPLLELKVSP